MPGAGAMTTESAPEAMQRQLMSPDEIRRALSRMAHEVVERNGGVESVVLVGIRTRGVPLARRMARLIAEFETGAVPHGRLDVTLYRDDIATRMKTPAGPTDIPFDITAGRSCWWTTCSTPDARCGRQWTPSATSGGLARSSSPS